MNPPTAPRRTALTRWHLAAIAVVLATAATVLHRLDAAEVCGANEAIEGVFVQQMVEHGALLFPLENGSAPMYKPPLFHWTATALDRIGRVGKVTAFNLRLPSALYAIAGVALTIAFAWAPLGEGGAVLAGMILAGSYQYVSEGRVGRVDMTLCFFETLALMSCLWMLPEAPPASIQDPSAGDVTLRYLLALALGLGVLAKGPVAIILPLGAIGVFLLRERRLGELRDLFTPGSLFVAIVVSFGWYVACAMGRRYGFLDRQLESENLGRFFGALGFMAPWYYLKPILLNSAPLSLMVPFAAAAALRRPAADARAASTADAAGDRARFDARLLATFWLLTVIFFSVAAYKRRAYLLPLWPSSAFLLAWGADEVARRSRWGRVARAALVALCAGLMAFNFVYLPRHEAAGCEGGSFQAAAAQINRTVGSDEPLYLYGFGDDPAPLLFYLDRDAPLVGGKLGDAPPGYVIVPETVWDEHASEALDLKPVLNVEAGGDKLLLLRRGGAIGMASSVGEASFR
ncbi:MAG TPA: phospholipid carrier-dependent glycosyltransferase [Candidatus Binataceae bacterium]|nr:phospholipid carrier-dependent glycosyltransferase [Candidatus Binataceae bacterium]